MSKNTQKLRRQARIRKKIRGTSDRPRLSVFRSNQYMYAQVIDDASSKTLVSVSEKQLGKDQGSKGTRLEKAKMVGMQTAKMAKGKKVKQVVFDKGSYAYHGRVKAVAEGAREGGLQF